jgi:hypothetical protein
VTGVNGGDLAPRDRTAVHLADRERELTLTLAAVAAGGAPRWRGRGRPRSGEPGHRGRAELVVVGLSSFGSKPVEQD